MGSADMTLWLQLVGHLLMLPPISSEMALSTEATPVDICQVSSQPEAMGLRVVALQGWVGLWPHDLVLMSEQCPDEVVVVSLTALPRSRLLRRLERYLKNSDDPSAGIRVSFEGTLAVAPCAG